MTGTLLLFAIVLACVALSGWMNYLVEVSWGGSSRATELGTVGQYFDAVSAVFSGAALLLVIGNTVLQRRELRSQREELSLQREALLDSNAQLRRSAEADLRSLHMQLLRMGIDDPELAAVWPSGSGPPERRRQFLYANLIFSHYFLNHRLGIVTDEEVRGHLRILGQSPVFRDYWRTAAEERSCLAADSDERRFGLIVDEVLTEPGGPPDLHVA
ncbi:DUF6082 family protein [Streptacidiphilus sp. MAP12-16]|uniref:DUF6082 family protein n=1 Tax=Streptacidiphilus sp. MAP12-16 TaxID=3156300 RepID=UPI0035178809